MLETGLKIHPGFDKEATKPCLFELWPPVTLEPSIGRLVRLGHACCLWFKGLDKHLLEGTKACCSITCSIFSSIDTDINTSARTPFEFKGLDKHRLERGQRLAAVLPSIGTDEVICINR